MSSVEVLATGGKLGGAWYEATWRYDAANQTEL